MTFLPDTTELSPQDKLRQQQKRAELERMQREYRRDIEERHEQEE